MDKVGAKGLCFYNTALLNMSMWHDTLAPTSYYLDMLLLKMN